MAASGSAFDAKGFQWVAQLPQAWESKRPLRERSLEGRCLLRGVIQPGHGNREVVKGNIECCKLNSDVLLILLRIMADDACIFVPKVFLLQGAMLEFHCHAGYPDAASLGVAAYSDGWGLKRMLTFVKRKWMRGQNARDRTFRRMVAEFQRAYENLTNVALLNGVCTSMSVCQSPREVFFHQGGWGAPGQSMESWR
ncbi:unnamed protein product [Symbiodinium sp. CCMP2592]|nr:unnamed protein product [Symbiodinium sp. CCMP2592]